MDTRNLVPSLETSPILLLESKSLYLFYMHYNSKKEMNIYFEKATAGLTSR